MPSSRPLLPPPLTHPDEAPFVCPQINVAWIPYIIGALRPMKYPEYWSGTLGENRQARQDVSNLIHQLSSAEECMATICCEDILRIYRINPENGDLEVSTDNGGTWNTAPGSIYAGAVTPAPLSGVDGDVKRCEAANNVVENLKDVQGGISFKIGLGEDLFELAVAILVEIVAIVLAGVTGGALAALVVPLIPKIIETVRAIGGLDKASYDALFTEGVWTATRCIMYCNVGENGKFTADAWSVVKNQLSEQLGSGATQAGSNLAAMVDVWSLKGLNHAAAIGSGAEGNCDDCACGGCDLSTWIVDKGMLITQTASFIEATAEEVSPGDWSVQIMSPDDDECCCGMTYEILSGGVTITVVGFVPCGLPVEPGNINFSYAGGSLRWYDIATHDGPFTVRISASEC